MTRNANTAGQLVLELYVRDLKKSRRFYLDYGFSLARDDGDFVELQWDDSLQFLEQVNDKPETPVSPVGNILIMVPNHGSKRR